MSKFYTQKLFFFTLIVLIVLGLVSSIFSSPNFNNNPLYSSSGTAESEFAMAINLEPNNETAYVLLARSYQLSGNLKAVEQTWHKAVKANPNSQWTYKRQAQFYRSNHQSDEVIQTWQRAIDYNPQYQWTYVGLFNAYQQANNPGASVAVLQSAIQANPDKLWPYQRLANYYKSQKQWTLTEQTYNRAIQKMPNDPGLYQLLGNHLFSLKEWQNAIGIYRLSLTLAPGIASNHLNLGQSLLRTNQTILGIKSIEQAILLEPTLKNHRTLRQELARFPLDDQIASYERILATTPDDYIARSRLVSYYQGNQECAKAIDTAKIGTELEQNEALYQQWATTLQNCGELSKAIEVYTLASAEFPYASNFPLTLGQLQLKKGDLRSTISSFSTGLKLQGTAKNYRQINQWFIEALPTEQAIAAMQATVVSAEPSIFEPYQELIQKYRLLGQDEDALSVMMQAVRANSESAWPYVELAKMYLEDNRIDDALAVYDEAIIIEPENASIRYVKAQLLYKQGKVPQAIDSYQQAHQVSPESRLIQTRLGRALLMLGNLEQGARMMELAYQSKPDNNTYRFMRKAYEDILDWRTAQPYQERAALLRWPNNPVVAYRNLATIYANTEQSEAATYTYKLALATQPENLDTLTQFTNFYLAQSNCKAANEYGIQATNIQPSSTAYLQLADVYAQCGPPEALQIAQQRSVENYLIEQAPQSNKRNVVDRTIWRYRDVLPEEQVVAYLSDALAKVELDRVQPYIQLGWYYETVVDPPNPQQALIHYQQGAEAIPTSAKAVAAVGRVLHDGGAPEDALTHYRKAILLDQNVQSVRMRYGRALVESGETEQGQAVLDLALQLEQSDWYTGYAIEGYLTSLPSATALRYITETLTLVPSDSEEVYMPAVRYYLGVGDTAAAFEILALASESNPKLDWPHVRLSYVYRNLQDYVLALEQMKIAIQKQPQTAWNHHDLGLLYQANGDLDEALLSMAQAVALEPENGWYHVYFGQALLEDEQFESGSKELILALQAEQTEDVYEFVDALFTKHLTAEQAQNAYLFLIEDNPENELAQQYLTLRSEE